jgi:hypothetical protein
MRINYKELLKDVSDSVKIYEINYRDAEPLYNVEINGSPNVILHLNYMEAYEEAREAVK